MMSGMIGKLSRQFPVFPGKYSLLRFLLQHDIRTRKNVLVNAKNGLHFLLPNINEAIGFSVFINGVYEAEHIRFIVNNIPLNGCFIDAGANIGSICIPVAKQRPDVQVIAVEASAKVFGYLKQNVQINQCDNITLIHKALSNTTNQLTEFYSPDELYGKGSMSAVFTKESEMVETVTIDDLADEYQIDHIDLMKIDVEGYERTVFEGMNKLFSAGRVSTILMEFCAWAEDIAKECKAGSAQELLKENEFEIALINRDKLTPLPSVLKTGEAMLVATYTK